MGWDIPDTVLSKPLLGLNPILRYRCSFACLNLISVLLVWLARWIDAPMTCQA